MVLLGGLLSHVLQCPSRRLSRSRWYQEHRPLDMASQNAMRLLHQGGLPFEQE
jgi:hypothetical protein